MLGGNHRAAHTRAFQAEFINQFARPNFFRIFENATCARRGRLRSPALFAERLHALLDLRARQSHASENRAQCDVIFQRRATAIFHRHLPRREFAHVAVKIHHAYRLDDIERRAAHRARVHPQRAADAAGNAFKKFHTAQIVSLGPDRNIFRFRTRAAMQSLADDFNLAEIRMQQTNHHAANATVTHK